MDSRLPVGYPRPITILDLLDFAEFANYLFGFWLFLFSQRFRKYVLDIWRRRSWFWKLFIPIEVAVATSCGVLPVYFVWWSLLS